MSRRTLTTDPFLKSMTTKNSMMAMNSTAAKSFTKWVNKDIHEVAETGDWSVLLEKATKSTRSFRNQFYR